MKFLKQLLLLSLTWCLFSLQLFGIDAASLHHNLKRAPSTVNYPLNITVYPSRHADADVTICMHGYGGNYTTGEVISQCINEHVVSFNFPDANIERTPKAITTSSFGTINELIPAIHVVKMCLDSCKLTTINLYGFSAGGAALVNMLAVLNRSDYDTQLAAAGITRNDKKAILNAIQKGYVIIDCPLKSMEEIMDYRGHFPVLAFMAKTYKKNGLRPIDSLNHLQGLSLNILLNFQNPDHAVCNRDDALYASRLQNANKAGRLTVVTSYDEGHVSYHPALWQAYHEMKIVH